MRFLCIHGSRTNEEIFDLQSGGLRESLEQNGHIFKFMNGRLESEAYPTFEGMLDGPFYNHYPWNMPPGEDLAKAIEHTHKFMDREGPFDAVMGFSQGGALAASLIIHHAQTHPHDAPLFKLAVFICSDRPYEATGTQYITANPGTYPIAIPTVNIVGKKDHIYDLSMEVYKLCEPSQTVFFDHGEDHRIPFDLEKSLGMTAAVEQGIQKAQ